MKFVSRPRRYLYLLEREINTIQFYTWFEALLKTAWEACQGTDVLIESPSAMVGIHMAEKLGKLENCTNRQGIIC